MAISKRMTRDLRRVLAQCLANAPRQALAELTHIIAEHDRLVYSSTPVELRHYLEAFSCGESAFDALRQIVKSKH